MLPKKPVLLCILDGWGMSEETTGNAVALANTPCFDNLIKNYIKHINLNQNKIVFDIFIFRNLQNLVIFFKVFEFQKKLVKKKTFSKKNLVVRVIFG